MSGPTPIIQFGTSRFLQAHADLFVSEALARGEALGRITVVQTTRSPDSRRRIAAFGRPYPVLIRGIEDGAVVDRRVEVDSIARGIDANEDWGTVEALVVEEAQAIISNTGDRGYEAFLEDGPDTPVPRGFPAKLAKLLHARWRHRAVPLDIYPCELVPDNGAVLRAAVIEIARAWRLEPSFEGWLAERCRWPSSLVDRIVSEPLEPIGAIAEPYALWAIERVEGAEPPCRHVAVIVTDDLRRYERLKLFILNLGHTFLAERWLAEARPADETVRQAIADPPLRTALDRLYDTEILPVFAALGLGEEAAAYRRRVLERFANPFLEHRLADIATNHAAKKARRFGGLMELARRHAPGLDQPTLRAGLASGR